jgi:hypothetical protein
MKKINIKSFYIFSFVLVIIAIFSLASVTVAKSSTSTEKNIKNQNGQINISEHSSAVTNFVRTLFNVASSTESGIGQQVRIIAQQQNDSGTTTAKLIKKIQLRNKIKTFLFGSDYKNLGALRSEIVQVRNRLQQLNRLLENATTTPETQAQIQNLEQEQTKIENFIEQQEGKFSLFGWLTKLFNK